MTSPSHVPPRAQGVAEVVEFFLTRLMLKKYRTVGAEQRAEFPAEVRECEKEFTVLVERVVRAVAAGQALDAVEWLDVCGAFTVKWREVCHWLAPRKFREQLTSTLGAKWAREEEVPAARELPPVNLKTYKSWRVEDLADLAQPYLCATCGVRCNSLTQYQTHAQGRFHRGRLRSWQRKNRDKQPPGPIMLPAVAPSGNLEEASASSAGPSSCASQKSASSTPTMSTPTTPTRSGPYQEYPPSSFEHGNVATPRSAGSAACPASPLASTIESLNPYHGLPAECLAPLDAAIWGRLLSLDGLLARLVTLPMQHGIPALALAVEVAGVVPVHVARSIVDAASVGDVEDGVVALTLQLVEAAPEMRKAFHDVVEGMAAAGVGSATLHNDDSSAERRQSRYCGLVRFAARLAAAAVIPSGILLRCLEAALDHPAAPKYVVSAFTSVSDPAVFTTLDAYTQHEVRCLCRRVLTAMRMPRYVHAMFASFVSV